MLCIINNNNYMVLIVTVKTVTVTLLKALYYNLRNNIIKINNDKKIVN